MATFNKFNSFVEALAGKKHNLGSDTLKVLLTNSAPSASNTVKADITEISAGNGYTAGGVAVTVTSSSQTSGTYKLIVENPVISASGGAIGPFRYVVLYNDTASNDELIGWAGYPGGSISVQSGETFTITFDGSEGAIKVI